MIAAPVAAALIVCVIIPIALIATAPTVSRRRGPTWFDILPTLPDSKKRRGRLQQKARRRA